MELRTQIQVNKRGMSAKYRGPAWKNHVDLSERKLAKITNQLTKTWVENIDLHA